MSREVLPALLARQVMIHSVAASTIATFAVLATGIAIDGLPDPIRWRRIGLTAPLPANESSAKGTGADRRRLLTAFARLRPDAFAR